MAPDPRGQDDGAAAAEAAAASSSSSGSVIAGHKISLNVHYDTTDGGAPPFVAERPNVSTPPPSELLPLKILGLSNEKVTHIDHIPSSISPTPSQTCSSESQPSSTHSLTPPQSPTTLSPSLPPTPSPTPPQEPQDSSLPLISSSKNEVVIASTPPVVPKTEVIKVHPVMAPHEGPSQNRMLVAKEYFNGPDQLLPSTAIKTWKAAGSVRLRLGDKGTSAHTPLSVPSLLRVAAEKFPINNALAVKKDGVWQFMNYVEYYNMVKTVAKAFIKLGLDRYHGVCILGFNSPEWFIADLAAIFAGGFAAGIYTTNSAEACEHCARNCKAQIWVVEDHKQLAKVLEIKKNLPHLKTIIQYKGKPSHKDVLSWEQVVQIGLEEPETELEARLSRIAINQCCTLIYTSGTTGPPKGVMLSHDNITWTVHTNCVNLNLQSGREVLLSYLPLSHVAAQMADIYFGMYSGGTVYFAQPDALKGTLGQTLKEVRPTRFVGVPRVWEKIYEKMMEVGQKTKGVKRSIATWAKAIGLETNRRKQDQNFVKPTGYPIANALVFKKIKALLGLDRCSTILSGAAPIGQDILNYFHSLDICVTEIYGMSESSGPHTIGQEKWFKVGSVGSTVPGCYTHIVNSNEEGDGEVCMGGRNVCMGYLEMESKTHEAIDDDGWLHSGDIGRLDKQGFLYITGRLKELIITAGGENIPPVLIEDLLKAELPCISNAMLIGDRRKFLAILLTFKTVMDEEGEPLDTLTAAAIEWCRSVGSSANSIQDVLSPDERVMRAIQDGIDRTNKQATSNAQKIQKWTILPRDFTVAGEELGPTLKLKRPVVVKKYKDSIERFYY